jgi:hypothetical protein
MAVITFNLDLPDTLLKDATEQGLLAPQAMEVLLRKEVCRRRREKLFDSLDHLRNTEGAPMTEDEIQVEIDAVRRERRQQKNASSR